MPRKVPRGEAGMELEEIRVQGFRSLATAAGIPVGKPTILTGANDGGKSSVLEAVAFLLDGRPPTPADHTLVGAGEPIADAKTTAEGRCAECVVEGRFRASEYEIREIGLHAEVRLRRRITIGHAAQLELLTEVPAEPALRRLDKLGLNDLKQLAISRKISSTGKANEKASWLAPLQSFVATQATTNEWMLAPSTMIGRLPRFVLFSSTSEPDPEREAHTALVQAFRQILEDPDVDGPLRTLEARVKADVESRAASLCEHIRTRCPDLTEIAITPDVSFEGGFRGVRLQTGRSEDLGVGLGRSGAGRRRRINLAVWEWTQDLILENAPDSSGLVIAYDEPDTHLDYNHQRDLVDLLRDQAAIPGVRVIVATHSLNLIDRVDIGDVVHLRLCNDRTRVERLLHDDDSEIRRYLGQVASAMGLRNSVLLHERCFVGVEGDTEALALPVLFRLVTGMSLPSAGIALLSAGNNESALLVTRFLRAPNRMGVGGSR